MQQTKQIPNELLNIGAKHTTIAKPLSTVPQEDTEVEKVESCLPQGKKRYWLNIIFQIGKILLNLLLTYTLASAGQYRRDLFFRQNKRERIVEKHLGLIQDGLTFGCLVFQSLAIFIICN